ncbi:MAG: hypothetical protein WC575_03535 [Patescibacteria group bacterium]
MELEPQIQKSKKRLSKGFIITIILIVIAVLGWAGLTKAGFISNYLGIKFLCSEQYNPQQPYFPTGGGGLVEFYKPVIYLYPEQKQQVDVKINYQGNLIVSYPEYNNGWNVVAYPDGKIINLLDNREYSYLFWEGTNKVANYDLSSGFVVKGPETAKFLQDKLEKLGLTPKEYNEFIVYWVPKMQNNKYNLIHFATSEEYDDNVILEIDPKPDSLLRVFMTFKKIDNETMVKPQIIDPFKRDGFVVVEWGGTELK